MGSTKLSTVATCVYACVLVGALRVLRPGARRTVGALARGVAAALVGVVIEAVAHQQGFWQYTENDTSMPCVRPRSRRATTSSRAPPACRR